MLSAESERGGEPLASPSESFDGCGSDLRDEALLRQMFSGVQSGWRHSGSGSLISLWRENRASAGV